jgi:hypothetical protein
MNGIMEQRKPYCGRCSGENEEGHNYMLTDSNDTNISSRMALAAALLLMGPVVIGWIFMLRLMPAITKDMGIVIAAVTFGGAIVIWLLVNRIQPFLVRCLTAGVALALALASAFIAVQFHLWPAIVVGLVLYVAVIGLGAQSKSR